MVREDIFEGLKSGLARGKSLQESMQSFYNSGYDKKEIEEAAKLLLSNKSQGHIPNEPIAKQPVKIAQQPQRINPQTPVQKQIIQAQNIARVNQPVSYYNTQPRNKKKSGLGIIILLIVILLVLFGALIAVFMLKEDIINFFQ